MPAPNRPSMPGSGTSVPPVVLPPEVLLVLLVIVPAPLAEVTPATPVIDW